MAEYILTILRSQLMIVFSWGFHQPMALPENRGLRFYVNGFLYQGKVDVTYNVERDLFEISLANGTCVEDVYLDSLISVIDGLVEKVDNYKERVKIEYSTFTNI